MNNENKIITSGSIARRLKQITSAKFPGTTEQEKTRNAFSSCLALLSDCGCLSSDGERVRYYFDGIGGTK